MKTKLSEYDATERNMNNPDKREVEAPAETFCRNNPVTLSGAQLNPSRQEPRPPEIPRPLEVPSYSNKRPAHGIKYVDGQPTVIFDTICTKNRVPWLASHEVHALLIEIWTEADLWLVGRYVVMPDHIHLFAWETEKSIVYENWVRYWKSQFTKSHKNSVHPWQTDHWDRRMRSKENYESKWQYVRQNPIRAGLTNNEDQWPFQGELHRLEW